VADGAAASSFETIAANHTDDKRIADTVKLTLPVLERQWDDEGLPAEKKAELRRAYYAHALEAALKGYVSRRDGAGARRFLASHEKALGSLADKYRAEIGELGVAEEAFAKAEAAMQGARIEGYDWHNRQAAVDAALAVEGTPQVKAKTLDLVLSRLAISDANRKAAAEEKLNAAIAMLEKDGRKALASKEMAAIKGWMNDEPNGAAALWRRFERMLLAEGREDRAFAADERRRRAEENDYWLNQFKARPLGEKVAAKVDAEYVGRVDRVTLEKIRQEQNAAQAIHQKGGQVKEDAFTQMWRDTTAGLWEDKGHAENMEKRARLWYWQQLRNSGGEPPTRDDVDAYILRQLELGERDPGTFAFDEDVYRVEIDASDDWTPYPPEKQPVPGVREMLEREAQGKPPVGREEPTHRIARIDQVPAKTQRTIRAALQKKGHRADDGAVMAAYQDFLNEAEPAAASASRSRTGRW
jgi:hypothetical protein